MTTDPIELDLRELRRTWDKRRKLAQEVLQRIDTRGMSRPARDPDEREWLDEQGTRHFREDEAMGVAARSYYSRKYTRPASSDG